MIEVAALTLRDATKSVRALRGKTNRTKAWTRDVREIEG
jgi:hypothetical protein